MDSERLAAMFETIEQAGLGVHSVLVVRNGALVLEAYFSPRGPENLHNAYSCTKSFTSALVGIAIRRGYLDGVDQPVLDFFPDLAGADDDPRREAMTIEHLLTMRCGLDWPESSVSYSSPRNILRQMMASRSWVRFVLERPMVADPGVAFNYNTGCSHLLSAILQEATGMRTSAFARAVLFEPLDISTSLWQSDLDGITFGGGGLWMTPRDMAKFGTLYLQGGRWMGRQIVPAEWVSASTVGPAYGYQWWVYADGSYAAHGYLGQRIVVVPHLQMVVVVTGRLPADEPRLLIDSFIVPAARSLEPLPPNPEGLALLQARIAEAAAP
jgi:CubicO group peptidase (beta-lactamase class C family)